MQLTCQPRNLANLILEGTYTAAAAGDHRLTLDQHQALLTDLQQSQQRLKEAIADSLTTAERRMVYRVIEAKDSIGRGHWYTCSDCGHIYVVGNCGQLNEGGRCPECGTRIGGGSASRRAQHFELEMTE